MKMISFKRVVVILSSLRLLYYDDLTESAHFGMAFQI